MIDGMAERYSQLPSQVIRSGSTFDLFIYDTALGYRNLLQRRANGEPDEVPEKTLLAILEKNRDSKINN
jgi:hypothetical protein